MHYILRGKEPVEELDLMEWAKWYESADRSVAREQIGDVVVSTVFLGLDHGFGGKLLLFETMVFGGSLDQEMDRYEAWAEAEEGHKAMVERVREAERATA